MFLHFFIVNPLFTDEFFHLVGMVSPGWSIVHFKGYLLISFKSSPYENRKYL